MNYVKPQITRLTDALDAVQSMQKEAPPVDGQPVDGISTSAYQADE